LLLLSLLLLVLLLSLLLKLLLNYNNNFNATYICTTSHVLSIMLIVFQEAIPSKKLWRKLDSNTIRPAFVDLAMQLQKSQVSETKYFSKLSQQEGAFVAMLIYSNRAQVFKEFCYFILVLFLHKNVIFV
jgi:hypothetical protein